MSGGLGDDSYSVDDAGDVVNEASGEGTDLVQSAITYTLPANVENLTLTGVGNLNATGNTLANALYEKDRIGITTRGGKDRPGIRVSPHFYNTPQEVDRLLAALTKYTKTGV